MHLTLHGDFSCPFSALASERATRLAAAGTADIQWRAIQHLPDLPADSRPVGSDLTSQFEDELDQVRDLLRASERFPIRVPTVRVNTALATRAFASVDEAHRAHVRTRLFHAYWFDGRDIGDRDVLADLGIPTPSAARAEVTQWQDEWETMDKRMVPMMRLPDGYLSRGLGVLSRLSDLLDRHDEGSQRSTRSQHG